MTISRNIAWLAAVGAMVSCQGGASLAKYLFPVVGPSAATFLRVGIAAVLMLFAFRPKLHRLTTEQWRRIVLYGLSVALMNLVFYHALETVPLGVCVTVEFIGPLALALLFSRRPLDYLWTALAVAGILMIVPWKHSACDVGLNGILWAVGAGVGWALYILATNHVTQITPTHEAAPLGMTVAAIASLPFALCSGGLTAFNSSILLPTLGVATFSSALPFTFELIALKGLPEKTFSITLSVEPAIAALSGFVFLREALTPLQLAAMVLVIVASLGSTLTAKK